MSNSSERRPYSTDVADTEWVLIEPFLSPVVAKVGPGRPRLVDLREVYNAIRYLNRTGCQWDRLPRDFPAKSTVYDYFAASSAKLVGETRSEIACGTVNYWFSSE